jgi:hypothetical protein
MNLFVLLGDEAITKREKKMTETLHHALRAIMHFPSFFRVTHTHTHTHTHTQLYTYITKWDEHDSYQDERPSVLNDELKKLFKGF